MEDNLNILEDIIKNQKTNYEQLSELLILVANQHAQINEMKQVINLQSQMMNEMNQKMQSFILKLSDLEITTRINDESLQESSQLMENVLSGLEEVKTSIDNIKIYKMVTD